MHMTVSEIRRQQEREERIKMTKLGDPEVTSIYRWEIEDGPIVPNLTGTGQIRVEVVKLEEINQGCDVPGCVCEKHYIDLTVQGRQVKKDGSRYENRPYFDQADFPTREMYAEKIAEWRRSR